MQRKNLLNFISIFVLILSLLFYQNLYADDAGIVINVIDGDTIHILTDRKDKLKVRLQFIDAPELDQSYGIESKIMLERFILNKNVTVIGNKKDKYKRLLGVIYFGGLDINLEMIKVGAAWHFKKYAKSGQFKDEYLIYHKNEYQAKLEGLGLWEDNAIPPWVWRKN